MGTDTQAVRSGTDMELPDCNSIIFSSCSKYVREVFQIVMFVVTLFLNVKQPPMFGFVG